MTLVSCNLVHVTLKVVWVEIPAVRFCVKYHTARLPEPHWGRPDQAAGHLITPPLEKTNSLTMKHLSPPPPLRTSPPPHFLCFFLLSLSHHPLTYFLRSFLRPFPVFLHQTFFIKSCLSLCVSCCSISGDRSCERNSTVSGHSASDITLFSSTFLVLLHYTAEGYTSVFS